MSKIERTFVKDEDKKHSIRFKETVSEGDEVVLGTIYVKRTVLKAFNNADGAKPVVMTLEVQ